MGKGSTYDGPLLVIGAGLPRTGTSSLQAALQLFYDAPCYHMVEIMKQDHTSKWIDIGEGRSKDFENIFKGYAAAVDVPSCLFYQELMTRYPNAKVVLTVRDSPEAWFESVKSTVLTMQPRSPYQNIFQWVYLHSIPFWRRFVYMNRLVWDDVFFTGEDAYSQKACVQLYNRWVETVKATVPKEKLLVFNVKEGYKPLCAFLSKPVPDDPTFPRLNETAKFRKIITIMTVSGAAITAIAAATVGTGVYFTVKYICAE